MHVVDQKLNNTVLPVSALARSAFSAFASTMSTVTGEALIAAISSSTPVAFDIHFVVQPTARDSVISTGRSARIASIAFTA